MSEAAIDSAAALPDRRRRRATGWIYALLPALAVLGLVFFLPMVNLALKSLHLSAGPAQEAPEFTLHNYAAFFADPFYWELLGWTSLLGFLVVVAALVLALPVAYFLARSRTRWRPALLLMVIAPMLVSVVIRNLGWLPILGDSGLINWLLQASGATGAPVPLVNNFTGVAIGLVHALLPFLILTLTTVIQRIDPQIEEASINLGAPPFETFLRVVLPLARPGILAGGLLVFTLTISAYTTPAIMGGGRVIVMATYVQQQVSTLLDYAKGATVAVILLAWVSALFVVALRFGKTEA